LLYKIILMIQFPFSAINRHGNQFQSQLILLQTATFCYAKERLL